MVVFHHPFQSLSSTTLSFCFSNDKKMWILDNLEPFLVKKIDSLKPIWEPISMKCQKISFHYRKYMIWDLSCQICSESLKLKYWRHEKKYKLRSELCIKVNPFFSRDIAKCWEMSWEATRCFNTSYVVRYNNNSSESLKL